MDASGDWRKCENSMTDWLEQGVVADGWVTENDPETWESWKTDTVFEA